MGLRPAPWAGGHPAGSERWGSATAASAGLHVRTGIGRLRYAALNEGTGQRRGSGVPAFQIDGMIASQDFQDGLVVVLRDH
jgi:hypothetical protein